MNRGSISLVMCLLVAAWSSTPRSVDAWVALPRAPATVGDQSEPSESRPKLTGDAQPKNDRPASEPPDINRLNDAGFSELHYAAMRGDAIKVSELIISGANVNVQQGTFKGAPLQYAAYKGHADVVRLLIAAEALLDSVDTAGRTPLMWAAHGGRAATVKLLIDAGAKVNASTPKGWTPLMYARKADDQLSMQLLRNAGAAEEPAKPSKDLNRKSPFFSSPSPFISVKSDDSMEPLPWSDVKSTTLDVNVRTESTAKRVDEALVLPITIENGVSVSVRSRLTHEWHGGEWPPTDLYISVTPANVATMAHFVPVYVHGEKREVQSSVEIPGGESRTVNLRLDWPGTGSVPARRLVSAEQGPDYVIGVLMVFDVDGEKHFTISKLQTVDTGLGRPDQPARDGDAEPSETRLDAEEVAERRKTFRAEVDFLSMPDQQLPTHYKPIESLPAVVIPGASKADERYFPVVSAFLGNDPNVRRKIRAAIIVGFQETRTNSQVGIYAVCCESDEAARELMRPGLIKKGHLLLYIWKENASDSAMDAIRGYFADKTFPARQGGK